MSTHPSLCLRSFDSSRSIPQSSCSDRLPLPRMHPNRPPTPNKLTMTVAQHNQHPLTTPMAASTTPPTQATTPAPAVNIPAPPLQADPMVLPGPITATTQVPCKLRDTGNHKGCITANNPSMAMEGLPRVGMDNMEDLAGTTVIIEGWEEWVEPGRGFVPGCWA